jgi:hypothetical protein
MKRIQIDGHWYIREEKKEKNLEFNYAKTCLLETDDYSWEATLMTTKEGSKEYDDAGLWIDFIDKRKSDYKNWEKESWDNPSWFLAVYHNQKDALIEAQESMDSEGIEDFKLFIGQLIDLGWL